MKRKRKGRDECRINKRGEREEEEKLDRGERDDMPKQGTKQTRKYTLPKLTKRCN